ncbi:hypothetical protein [Pseudofrankia inefficax]|uniref:hypothetical protein n=1 Tax=Pseudofrankia inefficax (strain DSM 45817 / CECT 9037 / DDB 130130 / EuI1c) TaxID=298654 RepID=UPI0002DCD851|nr:hypothetical protein [Pseudofrankia inefficax]
MTPQGDLVAVPARGTMLGNRGVLHDDDRHVVRAFQHRRWLLCELEFQGRRRQIMKPHRYTELFFLDEAVGLAAGHRPCARCRPEAYASFRRCFATGTGPPPGADELDRVLHAERLLPAPPTRPVAGLPDGAFVLADGASWLVLGDSLLQWEPGGYAERRRRPAGHAPVLTPASTVAALRAGYRPRLHASAAA